MPRINRMRIINFSYNNERRHILDETFDFHGGENALLNLANGGGKSVLVQVCMQPVVPMIKIQTRSIAGFFKKKRVPAYIMIEWKLEGGGGYLLTGIAMVAAEAQGMEEEERTRIKFFTFTEGYARSNPFDIAHLGLVTKKGNILEILPYKDAAAFFAERARKNPLDTGYFPQDDGDRYRRHLASFNISQDEWRHVISRVNDSEGGLEEIFLKCRTSDQLLNEWIVPTVEKVLFRERDQSHRLDLMLESLVEEIAANEQFILDKELLQSFLGRCRDFSLSLQDLLTGLDGEKKAAAQLAALFAHLGREVEGLRELESANDASLKECRQQEERIDLESRSFDYHNRLSEHQEKESAWERAESLRMETESQLKKNKEQRLLQQAALVFGEIKELKGELAGINEAFQAAQADFDRDGRISSLEYSLRMIYQAEMAKIQTVIGDGQGKQQLLEGENNEYCRQLTALDGERQRLSQSMGLLKGKNDAFQKIEEELAQQLQIQMERNLLGELNPISAGKKTALLKEREQSAALRLADLIKGIETAARLLGEIEREISRLQSERQEARLSLKDKESARDEYDRLAAKMTEICQRNGLSMVDGFAVEKAGPVLAEAVRDLESRSYLARQDQEHAASLLRALKSGTLHVPADFAQRLADLDIDYQTGESYLRHQPADIRARLLAGNPLLPYAFIISRESMGRLSAETVGIILRQPLPLLAYEDLQKTPEAVDGLVKTGAGYSFLCLYEGRMFGVESLDEFMDELTQDGWRAGEELANLSVALEAVRADLAFVNEFNFSRDYRSLLAKEISKLNSRINALVANTNQEEEAKKNQGIHLQAMNDEKPEAMGQLELARRGIDQFAEFLKKNQDYEKDLREIHRLSGAAQAADKRKTELEKLLEGNRSAIRDLEKAGSRWATSLEQVERKFAQVRQAQAAPLTEGDASELEERLSSLKSGYQASQALLEKQRTAALAALSKKEKEIRKLNVEEALYIQVLYDEQLAESLDRAINNLENLSKEQVKT